MNRRLKTKKTFLIVFHSCIILSIFLFSSIFAIAAEPSKVLIFPFNIHSKDDLSFLNTGIINMLSSGLAKRDEVVIIKPPETAHPDGVDEETAIKLASDLNADYVVIGNLTVFGNSVSTNAKFIDVIKNEPLVTLNEYGENRGDVLSHVNLFTAEINKHLFGGEKIALQPPVQKEEKPELPQSPQPIAKPVEKPVKKPAENKVAPAKDKTSHGIWKSGKFGKDIKSIAIGDVDGDGKNETVFITTNEVFIYQYENESLVKKGEIKGKGYHTFLYVDVADINKNKKAEIFVTGLSGKGRLNSFVLEYDGLKFKKIVHDANFYYRVLNIPGRGNILLGQKRGMLGTAGAYEIDPSSSLFLSGVFELKWQNKSYKPADRLDLPGGTNVYGFTYGDVLNDGREMIAAFTKDNRLVILDKNGNEEFKSRERYGGSAAYLEFPVKGKTKMDRFYLPQRIFITDFDKNGKNEVITVRSHATISSFFKRFKSFDSGQIECLTWNNVTLKQKWKTDEISGYISDLAVGDIDNDGFSEIVFPVITKSGSVLKKKKSHIIAWKNPE